MKLNVFTNASTESPLETLIVFTSQTTRAGRTTDDETKTTTQIHGTSKALKSFLLAQKDLKGGLKECIYFRNAQIDGFQNILSIGLGNLKGDKVETLRQATAYAFGALKANKITAAALLVDSLSKVHSKSDVLAHTLAEALTMSSYTFNDFKKKKETTDEFSTLHLLTATKSKHSALKKGLDSGATLAEAVNFSRWLGDHPGNKMTPTRLGQVTERAAKGSKLKVTVWDKAQIKKNKMGALLGVSAGSDQDPRLILMEYKGASAKQKPICFVGKGLTFDAGGISLKPSAGMEEMKYDMCGGANVIGTLLAIARLKLKVNAIGIVPASENLPGPSACKPGDILTAMNGTTIEVNNTDAEGRLILSDALCLANSKNPALIVDAATLTGAMMIALGSSHTGVYTNNNRLIGKIKAAAEKAGERVWHMPMCEDHNNDIRGTYADLSNIGPGREAGSATAAAFLYKFVDNDIPWAHFDIAGTAWHNGKRLPYHPKKGASGVMVRTFVELARNH